MTNNFSKMQICSNNETTTTLKKTKLELMDFESVFYCPIQLLSFDDFLIKYYGTNKIIRVYEDDTNNYKTINMHSYDGMDIIENLIISEQFNGSQTIYTFNPIPFVYSEIHLIVEGDKILSHSHVNEKIDSEYILEDPIIEDILSITANYKDKLLIELGLISVNGKQQWKLLDVSIC
jgi:hypothetical protein